MRGIIAGLIVALAAGSAAAQDAALAVHPVAGVFGLEVTGCDPVGAATPDRQTARVAQPFCHLVTPTERVALAVLFVEQVRARFPNIRADLTAAPPSGVTRETLLSQTAVASLHLSRVDLWTVEEQAATEVFTPLTLTLMMTDVLTGEVLFTETLSTVVEGSVARGTAEAQAARQLPGHLRAAVQQLVVNAAARWRPNPVSGQVRARAGDYWVVDVGRRQGVREGDFLGADARVVYSDAAYSVVQPQLGSLSTGQRLTRQTAQPIEVLQRPSAMVVVVDAPDGMTRPYIAALAENAIGQRGGLAVAPVNASLAEVRGLAIGGAGVAPRPRALPDYFLRVSAVALDPVVAESNVAGVQRRVQAARVFVEVIDHGGRVVFSTTGESDLADQIVGGAGFSPEQRRDTAVKNALEDAAARLGRDFRPARLRLDVDAAGNDGVRVTDPGGALGVGASAVVVRRQRVSGVEGEVWVPVTTVQVASVDATGVTARYADVTAPRIRRGDQIAYESAAASLRSRRRFAQCRGDDGALGVSWRGAVRQPLYPAMALNGFAGGFAAPVEVAGFADDLRPMLRGGFGELDGLGALTPAAGDVCFEPVHQVDAAAAGRYALTIGYVLKRGGERVTGGGLQQTLTATRLPDSADAAQRDAALQTDLAGVVAPLARRAAADLTPPT